MSYGFLFDLHLELATSTLATLDSLRAIDHPLTNWPSDQVEAAELFGPHDELWALPFRQILDAPDLGTPRSKAITKGDTVTIDHAFALDKSQLELGAVLGPMLAAVAALGGSGSLRIVNDGTYVGAEGWELTIVGGAVATAAIEDVVDDIDAAREELVAKALPEVAAMLATYSAAPAKPEKSPPAAKKKMAKKPAKTSAKKPAKKPAKTSAKKPAKKPAKTSAKASARKPTRTTKATTRKPTRKAPKRRR
jgi:hypothetical protein